MPIPLLAHQLSALFGGMNQYGALTLNCFNFEVSQVDKKIGFFG